MSGEQLDLLDGGGEHVTTARPVLDVARPPVLAEYEGQAVTWLPWQQPLRTTLRFHTDMSCEVCGCDDDQPYCSGTVLERRRMAHRRRADGYAFATLPETYPVRALMAFRCPGCGTVGIVAHGRDDWYITEPGPGQLPIPVRRVERPTRKATVPAPRPPRTADNEAPEPVATPEGRRRARTLFEQLQAEKRTGPPIR